jgi:Fur family peroxide stress response transcriptional regulator
MNQKRIKSDEIRKRLVEKGLRVTPQRIAVLDAIYNLGNHPSADQIIDFVRKANPNIATGTVYKVLDTLTYNRLTKRVTTDMNIMRYDGEVKEHHHLYCTSCDVIDDYVDEELNQLLENYFRNKKIEGFQLQEFSVQIKGTFDKC